MKIGLSGNNEQSNLVGDTINEMSKMAIKQMFGGEACRERLPKSCLHIGVHVLVKNYTVGGLTKPTEF